MDYLDYLPNTDYDQLPPEVQVSIDRATYQNRQRLADALASPSAAGKLPHELASAFEKRFAAKQTPRKLVIEGMLGQGRVGRHSAFPLRWLAAAGWLLFLVTGLLLYQANINEKTVYQLVSAPVLPAVVLHDTIFKTVTEQVYVVRYDTLIQFRESFASTPQYVYLRDTVYLPNSKAHLVVDSVNVSQPAAKNRRFLELLVETE